MANNHIITRGVGNLRGFSTDSIFVRPSNVADTAINIQRAPDRTLQLRRGYQCQIEGIGGMGTGTFDNTETDTVETVTLGMDGYLYSKLEKQIYLYYDGQVTGSITGATQTNPVHITSPLHGLITGAIITITDVVGMIELNNNTYTITVTGPNTFDLDGINGAGFTPYVSGGQWVVTFTQYRYLIFTIFTDPRYLSTNPGWSIGSWSFSPWGAPSGASITCNITVARAAVVVGSYVGVNTINVQFPNEMTTGAIIQFYDSNGIFQQRNVTAATTTSITFDGVPANITSGAYINQFLDIPFRNGFDVMSPYLISTFISTITAAGTGVFGLQVAINGDDFYAAAFLQIVEPVIIDSNLEYTLDYWYWEKINFTISPPFPGTANLNWQNSQMFENASLCSFNDVIYIANGWEFPQKYDGQTVYRAGMPIGQRPLVADYTGGTIQPFNQNDVYEYAVTYEQVDNMGNIIEGQVSAVRQWTIVAMTAATEVTVNNLTATKDNNWNTNTALAIAGTSSFYGPDINGFYYDKVNVTPGYTLKYLDTAYYYDTSIATVFGLQTGTLDITVDAGHGVQVGDAIYFIDNTATIARTRIVIQVTDTLLSIEGLPVSSVSVADDTPIAAYKTSVVYGDVAIVNGDQNNINTINVDVGHTIVNGDIVEFTDADGNLQRRTVTGNAAGTITINGIPVDIKDDFLISSINLQPGYINLQRNFPQAATFTAGFLVISNNLRINIYRTNKNQSFNVLGELYLVATIPNNGLGTATQNYFDIYSDLEITFLDREFDDPPQFPLPPPVSKYLRAFGSQMFYAGGERNVSDHADFVFFSEANSAEAVPAQNSFTVPNTDDDITGIGVSGSTLVVGKNNSWWGATGDFLSGQIDVVQICPGANIGCVAHAAIASVGSLMYFLHSTGVYAMAENTIFPTDEFGNPIPISLPIDNLFRETNFIANMRYVLQRAVACNYTKDKQYLLFLPCENVGSSIRTANSNSLLLCYDHKDKNWFQWYGMNAAGGIFTVGDDLYFQERVFSGVDGNRANLYKQHRFYRLVDHADHASPQKAEWLSSWEDLGQPEVRKKFCRCVLLMDRLSDLQQFNAPQMYFSSYTNRIPNLQSTMALITQTDNIRNASWSNSPWGFGFWSGYQDSFVTVNLKQGTVAKSIQVGFTIQGINMDIRLAGFQLECIPENRRTIVR